MTMKTLDYELWLSWDGGGRFERVVLRPTATVAAGTDSSSIAALHEEAASRCFIARSFNFPVHHEPRIELERAAGDGDTSCAI